jgi:hypothetical protein
MASMYTATNIKCLKIFYVRYIFNDLFNYLMFQLHRLCTGEYEDNSEWQIGRDVELNSRSIKHHPVIFLEARNKSSKRS